jgi:uncharacterized coiled-coil protein SlyX
MSTLTQYIYLPAAADPRETRKHIIDSNREIGCDTFLVLSADEHLQATEVLKSMAEAGGALREAKPGSPKRLLALNEISANQEQVIEGIKAFVAQGTSKVNVILEGVDSLLEREKVSAEKLLYGLANSNAAVVTIVSRGQSRLSRLAIERATQNPCTKGFWGLSAISIRKRSYYVVTDDERVKESILKHRYARSNMGKFLLRAKVSVLLLEPPIQKSAGREWIGPLSQVISFLADVDVHATVIADLSGHSSVLTLKLKKLLLLSEAGRVTFIETLPEQSEVEAVKEPETLEV